MARGRGLPTGTPHAPGGRQQLEGIEGEQGAAGILGNQGPAEAGKDQGIASVQFKAIAALVDACESVVQQQQPVVLMLGGLHQQGGTNTGGQGHTADLAVAVEVPPVGDGAKGLEPAQGQHLAKNAGGFGGAGGEGEPLTKGMLERRGQR